MILADKIIENRKKNGWSQEELAHQLGVSRQSVSKWESAQAVPDMKRILQLSEIFGVSTDYLMKDEIESVSPLDAPVDDGLEETIRKVTIEEAGAFLEYNESASRWISTGVMLCIFSPALLILGLGLSEIGTIPVNRAYATVIGVSILLVMVAIAVGIFIREGIRNKPYEYLESINIDTDYGVDGMVKEKRDAYANTHMTFMIIGVMLCILSAIPLLMINLVHYTNNTDLFPLLSVVMLLVMCGIGVKLIVKTSIRQGGFDRLLEEGDYTRINKKAGKYDGIYWTITTAIYLGWSFITSQWQMTWIVWPIAGVLFAAYREIIKAFIRRS